MRKALVSRHGLLAFVLAASLAPLPCLAQNSQAPANAGGLASGSTNGSSSGGTVNRQPATAPNGRSTMLSPASHTYSIRNYTGQPIVDATATMTDGSSKKMNPNGQIAAAGASEIVVPLNECLSGLTIRLKDGHSFQDHNLNDCAVTQIVVNRNGIQISSTQTPGAQNGTPTK